MTDPNESTSNEFIDALPAETRRMLSSELKVSSPGQGEILLDIGQPVETVYFPKSGVISLLVVTKEGAMVETGMVGREGAVGVHRAFGTRHSLTRATMQVPGSLLSMRASRFAEIAAVQDALRASVAVYGEILWAEAQQSVACNAVHDANARLCRWLLQASDRARSEQVPLTQDFLAQMLGVRRTTVTLLAQALQRRELIKYSRARINILDRPRLEASACECYHSIRRDKLLRNMGIEVSGYLHA